MAAHYFDGSRFCPCGWVALGVINITDEQELSRAERCKGPELRTTARLAVRCAQSHHLSRHEAIVDGSRFFAQYTGQYATSAAFFSSFMKERVPFPYAQWVGQLTAAEVL